MRIIWERCAGIVLLAAALAGSTAVRAEEPPKPAEANKPSPPGPKKYQDFAELTKDSKKHEGFFTLHEKGRSLYAEIKPNQLDQPILAPIAIARGSASAGNPLNFGDEWVLSFRKVEDDLQLIRRNVHFTAASGTPLEKAVKQNYTDSILMALPILSVSPAGGAFVVDLGEVFMGDFAQVGLGSIDKARSRWFKIRAYPNNVEIQVEATFSGGGRGYYSFGGTSPVVDPRGTTMVIHYSLCKAPDPGYKPRAADYRVGHFLNAVTDYSQADPDSDARRMINRWRLEKADPKAKLSPPKKQVVWWIEDNVPLEHRPYVEAGILEWNKAFEKIGILNALAVRWQNSQDDFEPEDINYCTLRWITSGSTYAMSGLRSDPTTGEMIDGDVIFDASWIKTWKEEYAMIVGVPTPAARDADRAPAVPLAMAEVISPIMASKQGFGLPIPPPGSPREAAMKAAALGLPAAPGGVAPMALDVVPAGWDPIQAQIHRRMAQGRMASCNYSAAKTSEMRFASLALAALAADDEKKDGDKDKEKDKEKKDEPRLPEGFLGQAIKEVVMHEVGHSLGLRHNFKASVMLRPEEVNDTNVTRAKGLTGSVMDYNPINIAPKGQKQGDYASTTIGPYDYWAIEYAYKPIDGDEAAELKKIAAKSPDPDLTFATDDDFYNNDPQVNTYDLSSDTLAYGKQRMEMAAELLKDLDAKVVRDDESWGRLRTAFGACVSQFGNGAYLAAQHVGGQSVSRDFKGTEKAKDPVVPVAGDRQREALKLLVERILSDRAFGFSPALLRKLVRESWQDQGFGMSGNAGYPVYDAILNIQEIAFDECLAPSTLRRLQDQEAQSEPGSNPLKIEEVFRAFTDGVFSELAPPPAGPSPTAVSTARRNLQREYVKRLSAMVLGPKANNNYLAMYSYVILLGGSSSTPPDAKNLARLHLGEIRDKIGEVVARKEPKIDDTTLAHLKELRHRIDQVLDAKLDANEP
ncbi:MAG: hypothetical protein BGO49_04570 [Planctomycetales bacterium 71-10]|nr:MAG: hypothetical protein BGO49_04570 [Planctomycetales bacterium 71-10]